MKATITLSDIELQNLIRQHLLRVPGIDKIVGMKFNAEADNDELPYFTNVTVAVELKESN